MNYKCVCIIIFIFSKFRSTGKNHSSTAEISRRLLKLHVPELIKFRRTFFLSHHTRGGQSHSWSSSLTFWTLNYLILKERKGRKIFKLTEILIVTRSLYNYSMWERTGARTFGVRLQRRLSSHVKLNVKSDAPKVNFNCLTFFRWEIIFNNTSFICMGIKNHLQWRDKHS